ncbi:MAG: flagellar basal body-associated FliL family protein [Rhizobiales bacterium]|nr:flagellar basal body-associated FliL family protein [Hyphomicrobiales bacterium]MBI3672097.1 flagellar basal body-associated FliL family protein [Hyphomicrobiales bacterium]
MADNQERGGRPSLVAVAIVVLLLTLAAAGAGVAVGVLLGAPPPSAPIIADTAAVSTANEPAKPGDTKPQSETAVSGPGGVAKAPAPATVVPLPPILTNLADPPTTWIRLEGAVLVQKETEESQDQLVERADEQIVAYLRTVKLGQIEGPSGFLYLREDLNDVVSTLSKGQVRAVLISSMVLE